MSEHEPEKDHPLCDCAPDCAERIACPQIGTLGHMGCGWCEIHDQARHICLCQPTAKMSTPPEPTPCCPLSGRCRTEGYCITEEVEDLMSTPPVPTTDGESDA